MSQTIHHRLHLLEAADWKDGVITLLEPNSPYRPWRYAFGEARPRDYALLVLGTDPASVLTVLARIDEDGGLDGAMLHRWGYRRDLVDLDTLAMLLDLGGDAFTSWRLDDDEAERVILAVHESQMYGSPFNRWGHSSVAAARNLLDFQGSCHACRETIRLDGADARDQVHVHTVDPLPRREPHSPIRTSDERGPRRSDRTLLREAARDWPAILCRSCHTRMRESKYSSFVDFRFAQNPQCPRCGGQRTQTIQYGYPADPESWGPWLLVGGCCVRDEKWHCELCGHEWH